MFDSSTIAAVLRTLLLFAAFAVLFVIVAQRTARRYGRAGVLGAWVTAAVLLALASALRLQTRQASLGFAPNEVPDARTIAGLTLWGFAAFGAAALVVWRRHQRGDKLTGRTVLWGVAAFFGGVVAFFVVFLLADLFTGLRR